MGTLKRIISGGQTGADRGGLDAAIELGIPHGGWCPKGRRAEDGAIPAHYELQETASSAYPERTRKNVLESDGTVVFTFGKPGGGSALTIEVAQKHGKPCLPIDPKAVPPAQAGARLRDWLAREGIQVLNVAGSRESSAPGIQDLTRALLVETLGIGRN